MKNKHLFKLVILSTIFSFIACDSSDPEPWIEPQFSTDGVFILHEGNWGDNDAILSYYEAGAKEVSENIFENKNKLKLGDIAQDVLTYGSKMYISVTNSNKIFITDLKGKLLAGNSTMEFEKTEYNKPRYFASHNGKVYVNFYSGQLAQIDTTSLTIEKNIKIEENTEQMTVVGDELFILDTGYGSGKSITVVNLINLGISKSIPVHQNPKEVTSDKAGNIFFLSFGKDYVPILYHLSAKTKEVSKIAENVATNIAISEGNLLLANRINATKKTVYTYYDIYKKEIVKESFINVPEIGAENLGLLYSLSIDPVTRNIYITTTDYSTTGSMYIFTRKGELIDNFKTGGLNPLRPAFVSKQIN